ncbi:MAG: hypothetical protein ACTII7_09295 [Galactobacter sp.]
MGLDWTALEEGLRRTAYRQASVVIGAHPDHHFYGVALHGVPTDELEPLVLPVLALNSEEALLRDLTEDDAPIPAEEVEPEERFSEDAPVAPLDGSDPVDPDEDEDDEEDDLDAVAEEPDVPSDDGAVGFYSRRWDPVDWHWNALDLVDEAAAGVWERAFAAEVEAAGWEPTAYHFYQVMVAVMRQVREDLTRETGKDLVCFVADDDHAERLLRACLTSRQLAEHFPELIEPLLA